MSTEPWCARWSWALLPLAPTAQTETMSAPLSAGPLSSALVINRLTLVVGSISVPALVVGPGQADRSMQAVTEEMAIGSWPVVDLG